MSSERILVLLCCQDQGRIPSELPSTHGSNLTQRTAWARVVDCSLTKYGVGRGSRLQSEKRQCQGSRVQSERQTNTGRPQGQPSSVRNCLAPNNSDRFYHLGTPSGRAPRPPYIDVDVRFKPHYCWNQGILARSNHSGIVSALLEQQFYHRLVPVPCSPP